MVAVVKAGIEDLRETFSTAMKTSIDTLYEETGVPTVKTTRERVLDIAKTYITESRNASYGEPEDNFRTIADFWSTYRKAISAKNTEDLPLKFDPVDIAVMMILVKVARLAESPANEDNWIDIAGYAACGAECVLELEEPEDG